MHHASITPPRRGHPPKAWSDDADTLELLVRAGLEVLTEKGFAAAGIDEILSRVKVPKGSFYYYVVSKQAFGLELIDRYVAYFAHKLDSHFCNSEVAPLAKLELFIADAVAGMERFEFKRGCLIGNMGQEMGALPESFRPRLVEVFADWERRTAVCLEAGKLQEQIAASADCQALATAFWIGWERAVLRAKLERSTHPLTAFSRFFIVGLPKA